MSRFLKQFNLPVLVNQSRVVAEISIPRKMRRDDEDHPPKWLERSFRDFRPHYRYGHFGVMGAFFDRMERWRGGHWAGHWVGFYKQEVVGPAGRFTERYVWAYADGKFYEVKQFGLANREHVRV